MSEKNVILTAIQQLSHYFDFSPKIKGTHFSKKRVEIDFIIKPKIPTGWRNVNVCFGVEFKDMEAFDKRGNTKDFSKWLAQCVDYANTDWDHYGYVYILTCPGIQTSAFVQAAYGQTFMPRFLAQLGVGELKLSRYYGWTITLHGDNRIWSEKNGVENNAARWNLKRTFGSR